MAINLNESDVEKFNSIVGTFSSSMMSASKSSKAREIAEQSLIKSIMKVTGENEASARAIAKTIRQEEELEKKREQREQAMADGVKRAVDGLKDFFGGAVQSSQALYNTDNAFTGVIPTLQLMGNAVKAITGALSTFLSGLPIIGAFATAADKAMGVVIDIGVQVMQAQMENAGKMVENFNNITKSGMTFGASLQSMQQSALDAGMSVGTFSKFVTGNIENLVAMGGVLERNTAIVGKESRAISENNKSLLALYGSYDALAGATSGYMAQLSGYGVDITKLTTQQKNSITEYLYQQKELTALTGKSAETLKKDEEARRQNAAYQLNLARLGGEQQLNVQRNIETFGRVSKDAGDFATEMFNTQGNVTSKQALLFQQQFPELAETIRKTQTDAQKLNADDFKKQQSEYMSSRADLLKREADRYADLYKLSAGGVKGEYIDQLNRTAAGTIGSYSMLKNLLAAEAEFAANRKKMEQGAGNATAGVIKSLEDFKKGMDTQVIASFTRLTSITEKLIMFNQKIVDTFTGPASKLIVEKLDGILNAILAQAGLGPPEPPRPDTSPTPTPTPEVAKANREAAERAVETANAERDRIIKEEGRATDRAREARIRALEAEEEARRSRAAEEHARRQRALQTRPGVPPTNLVPTSSGASMALPFKSPESTAGGTTDPIMQRVLEGVYTKNKNFIINGINDLAHKTPGNAAYNPTSPHLWGGAADLKATGSVTQEQLKKQIIEELTKQGVKGKVELHRDAEGTGSHLHLELDKSEKHSALSNDLMEEQNGLLREQNDILRQLNRTTAMG